MNKRIDPANAATAFLLITLFVALSYARLWTIRDGIWDDNCWLLSAYATENLGQFLETGFAELRRVGYGIFLYFFFGLHRDSDYFYAVWHSLNLLTQIGTPWLIYLLVRSLFPAYSLYAVLSALAFVIFPLDFTLPYASGISHRMALLLNLLSIYLTHRTLTAEKKWLTLTAALLTAGLGYYVFMEAAIALEPARIFAIAYHHYLRGHRLGTLTRSTAVRYLPFFLLCLSLVFYKLGVKSHGIYADIYRFNPLFMLQWWDIAKALAHFAFLQWWVLLRHLQDVSVVSYILGIVAFGVSLLLYRHLADNHDQVSAVTISPTPLPAESNPAQRTMRPIILFGALLFLPSILIHHAFSQPISWGMHSNHAVLAQAGYAMATGWVLWRVFAVSPGRRGGHSWASLLVCAWIGLGVFFSNANIDMYRKSWEEQSRFWTIFMQRFPTLPEHATFFFDVQDGKLYSDLINYNDFEFQMNHLYDRGGPASRFRKYMAYTITELHETRGRTPESLIRAPSIERLSHLGKDILNPRDFIVVHYRNGRLLVGQEVLREYPTIAYRDWLR